MKLIITPDYGGLSDITYFNYPIKELLSQSLKNFRFPIWTDFVGNGFPLGAEGQIGIFSPLNWLIFGVFPMPFAFMFAYFVAFAIMALGTYSLAKNMGLNKLIALISAVFSTISGFFIVHLVHLNLLQSFSFIPFTILLSRKLATENWKRGILLLSFVFSQIILVGYPQTFFYSSIILFLYLVTLYRDQILRLVVKLGMACLLAIFLSAIQVIPLIELVAQSDTIGAAGRQRFIHQITPKHFLLAINPFLFGDPSRGTYPQDDQYGSRFVENLFYPGLIPLVGFCVLLYYVLRKKLGKYNKEVVGLLAIFVLSIILSLGKYTPLKILFKLPPFSFTRIESRFLAFSTISFGVLAGFGINFLIRHTKGKVVLVASLLLLSLHALQMTWIFRSYHLFSDSKIWLKKPVIAGSLPTNARVISFNQESIWDNVLPKKGWYGKEFLARNGLNSLGPNSNIVFGVKQIGVYAQQLPLRQELIQRNMYGENILGRNIRDLYGVTHVIDASSGKIEVVENPGAMPDIWTSNRIYPVKDTGEALGRMAQPDFIPGEILWESETMPNKDEKIVVINRSWYPGWKAYAGKQQIKVYPANINQQAVIVPASISLSEITLKYDPLSYKIGFMITLASTTVWIVLFLKTKPNQNET